MFDRNVANPKQEQQSLTFTPDEHEYAHIPGRLGPPGRATDELISVNLTLGKSRMWLASNKSSSKLREYRKMSSGTVGKEQCRLSTYSTCLLQPLNRGMQRNIVFTTLYKHCT